jgi:hypothetical protein
MGDCRNHQYTARASDNGVSIDNEQRGWPGTAATQGKVPCDAGSLHRFELSQELDVLTERTFLYGPKRGWVSHLILGNQ